MMRAAQQKQIAFQLVRGSLAAAGIAALVACGGAKPAPATAEATPLGEAEPVPAAELAPAAEPAPTTTDGAVSSNPPPAETAAASPEAELSPPELCQKMCDRLREKCTPDLVEKCRGNCREWDSTPPGCDAEVKAALECARRAEDLQCVNIVPSSCTKKFKAIDACASGKKVDTKEMSLDMPSGWQRFESKEAGFSVPMPPGVEAKEASGEKSFSASVGAATYSVRVLPAPPAGKKDLQIAQSVLGDCMKKLALKGLIERPERRSLEFKAGCDGGRQASGLLVTIGSKLYVVSAIGPGGAASERDVFVYGFRAPL